MWDVRYNRRALRIETLAESVAAATIASAAGGGDPTVLLYNPPARGNPYQQLLYSSALDHGICTVPLHDLDELEGFRWPYRTVVHIHWTSPIIQTADTDTDADRAADEAIELLERAIDRGVELVWTVHNVLPHECRYLEPEQRLRRWLADHAAMIHVLSATTPDLVGAHYRLPDDDRLVHVPHPSYAGVYPDHVGRAEARFELGVPTDAKVAVMVGSLRAYKGPEVVADALDRLDEDWVVLMAGKPIDDANARAIEGLGDADPRISVWPRHIATEEMQLFLRAADVAVLPYLDGLNSGVCALAMTFGLPVIAADSGSFAEVVTDAVGRVVPAGDATALAAALADVIGDLDRYRAGVEAASASRAPALISDQFFEALTNRLG